MFLFSILLSGFFCPQKVLAETNVVINEIAWMGNSNNANAEWLELKNLSSADIDLTGWTLNAVDGQPKITLSGKITASGYYLLERTSDDSVSDITADLIYTGALGNTGEALELKDNNGSLVDKIDNSAGWLGGDNTTKQTLSRKSDNSWCSSANPGGTPKAENDCAEINAPVDDNQEATSTASDEETATSTEEQDNNSSSAQADTSSKSKPAENISITEIYPNPKGDDRAGEFIELYNDSTQDVDLTGWRIEVKNGKTFIFGNFLNQTKILKSHEYYLLYRSQSNIVLDNNGGEIRLYKPKGTRAIQLLKYDLAPEGASYADTENISLVPSELTKKYFSNRLSIDRWSWSLLITPGKANEINPPNRPPIPVFSFSENTTVGLPVFFDASDSVDEDGDNLNFNWDFGDGFKSSSETPDHIFLKANAYQVKLIVSDGLHESLLEKTVKVPTDFKIDAVAKKSEEKIITQKTTAVASPGTLEKILQSENTNYQETSLLDFDNLAVGTLIKVSGTVIVEPEVFGTQYFYIMSPEAPALKIYNFKKAFPLINVGDLIEANGEVAQNSQGKYLKTDISDDVKIIGQGELPEAEKLEKLTEDSFNKFAVVSGVVGKKETTRFSLATSAGEVLVYIKSATKIKLTTIKEGEKVTVTGLIGKIVDGLALMPRNQDDLVVVSPVIDQTTQKTENITATATNWVLPERKDSSKTFFYILILSLFLIIILILAIFKYKKSKKP